MKVFSKERVYTLSSLACSVVSVIAAFASGYGRGLRNRARVLQDAGQPAESHSWLEVIPNWVGLVAIAIAVLGAAVAITAFARQKPEGRLSALVLAILAVLVAVACLTALG